MRRSLKATLVGVLCTIWGSTWLVIKIGLQDLPPFLGAGARFTVAAAILLILAYGTRAGPSPTRREQPAMAGLGIAGFAVAYGAVYWGEQYVGSGLAAVLFSVYPFLVLVLAHGLIPDERISLRKVAGVVLGFVGVVLIFGSDLDAIHPRALTASAVVLLSPLSAAVNTVTIKKWYGHIHPFHISAWQMVYGAIILVAISVVSEDPARAVWTPLAIGTIAYLAIAGSIVAFVVYYTLLRHVPASSIALVAYVVPIVAVTLGYLVLGETLTYGQIAGAAAIVSGVAMATGRAGRAPEPPTLE